MTPKSLLRHPACVSSRTDLTGGQFRSVIDDAGVDPANARRLLFASGKVVFDLEAQRRESGRTDVAIVRVERLYPFPADGLRQVLTRFANVRDVVWVQEEPRNMGAWGFIHERLGELLLDGQKLRYVGRPRSASPATGSSRRHQAEQQQLVDKALEQTSAVTAGD